MEVYTAHIGYGGADRFDVTRKTGGILGHTFAPSESLLRQFHPKWGAPPLTGERFRAYEEAYVAEMRGSYRHQRPAWAALAIRKTVTLCCYCTDPACCHRTILGKRILPLALGALYQGERSC
jgi:uncharacterized protein YeaO (DUF488 family)